MADSFKYKHLYIAATSQHVGKTTTTLGLVSAYQKMGLKVGYCKPVGQKLLDIENLRVDKDTILFADLIHFDIIPEIHSPVILGKGASERYLDDPTAFDFEHQIKSAAKELSKNNDLVIFEGTGHPGVGSVAEISNAKVAKSINAGVVMVVEGGIGSTIDMLHMSTALFRERKVPILGVILNKVIPEKMEKIEHYVKKWLSKHDLELLGSIPYDPTLAYPLIKTVSDAIDGTIVYNAEFADNRVGNILAGSLIDLQELKSNEDLLLLVSTKSINSAINKIKWLTELYKITHCPLSGIVATGQGNIDQRTMKYIKDNQLPLIRTEIDTYGAVLKISKIEVKINTSTPWKVTKAADLIEKNVLLKRLLEKIKL
ncbi:MAG TPA: AAA family ATPase [Saprospiraceae bacterium]|nr:AAA family ATPase [Saprospiraceae bacterium]HPN69864.1 AAA family ATPase [Saprospiraceae bacterium]